MDVYTHLHQLLFRNFVKSVVKEAWSTKLSYIYYNNCVVVKLVNSLYVLCISDMPHIVDKTFALDMWQPRVFTV